MPLNQINGSNANGMLDGTMLIGIFWTLALWTMGIASPLSISHFTSPITRCRWTPTTSYMRAAIQHVGQYWWWAQVANGWIKWASPGFDFQCNNPNGYLFVYAIKAFNGKLYIAGGFDQVTPIDGPSMNAGSIIAFTPYVASYPRWQCQQRRKKGLRYIMRNCW